MNAMTKIETIYHHILYEALQNGVFKHTQKDLADKFSYSLSTINLALAIPTNIGAIRKETRFFVLENPKKLLYYWASIRNLERDITYQTFFAEKITEIEGLMPQNVIYAGYTAAKKLLLESPADYSKAYIYADEETTKEIQERFPMNREYEPNIIVLHEHDTMKIYDENITTLPQTFVDVWNFKDWYSNDFTQALEKKMNGIL